MWTKYRVEIQHPIVPTTVPIRAQTPWSAATKACEQWDEADGSMEIANAEGVRCVVTWTAKEAGKLEWVCRVRGVINVDYQATEEGRHWRNRRKGDSG